MTPVFISPAFDPAKTNPHLPNKQYNGIWDTGATNTVITRKVADDLNLKPVGMTLVKHAKGEEMSEVYRVNIVLPNKVGFPMVRVTEGTLSGVDVLIGMDIINRGDFAITHRDSKTTFTFRVPSTGHIDFVEEHKRGQQASAGPKIGRNEPCPCKSGKKYKKCCGQNVT
ncbi:MAG: retroviral-like aspartic protease family protein [Nitrospirae bacterium]|nr:retroviral-like aspartic protease family protein [Nitrospirota bacterium]